MTTWSDDIWNDAELAGMPPGRERARAWTKLRAREIQSLEGKTVLDWFAGLWPLRFGESDELPQYHDPLIPVIQTNFILLLVEGLDWIQILTHQDDDVFGLFAQKHSAGPAKYKDYPDRTDNLRQLPRDKIHSVSLSFSEIGNIEKITLEFESGPVILVAAEAWEQLDGSLAFLLGDESVCLLTSEEDFQSIDWRVMVSYAFENKKARCKFNPTAFFTQLQKLIIKIGLLGRRG